MNLLNELSSYMLTNNNIIKWKNNIVEFKQHETKEHFTNKSTPVEKKNNLYKIFNEKDPFFWCFFYILNGEFEYMIEKSKYSTEKMYKIQYLEKLRTQKKELKKLKLNTNYIEDKLLNSISIDYITFITLCIVYDINFILNDGFFYWEHIINDSNVNIIKIVDKEVQIYIESNNGEIDNIKNKFIKSVSYTKKIKTISNYKVKDLIDISKKMKIELCKSTGKKKTKKDLYNEIQQLI